MSSSFDSFQRILSSVPKEKWGAKFDINDLKNRLKARSNYGLFDMYLGQDLEEQMNRLNMKQAEYDTLIGKMRIFFDMAKQNYDEGR